MKRLLFALICAVIGASFILGFHNTSLYNPSHGFDGLDHLSYIEFVAKHWSLPIADSGWETHQSPLYYVIGAVLMAVTNNWKTAQYLNIFILWLLIGMVVLGLRKVLKKRDQVLIGGLSLAALPMLNIFPPMITNELLNTFWVVSCAVACLYLMASKSRREFFLYIGWLTASFVLGIWTKISIIEILPAVIVALLIVYFKKIVPASLLFKTLLLAGLLTVALSLPVFLRASSSKGPSNVANLVTKQYTLRSPDFYYRLDWIPNVDMYNTQYYSMIGGAWNSFWSDGQNAITPFVKFHKKALILWLIGFILFPVSLYGLVKIYRTNKPVGLFVGTIGSSMLLAYVFYNIASNHYSAARLTYEMGIVVPYAFGIASASQHQKIRALLWIIIPIQFVTMISFFWIEPWWFVTR